MQVQVGSYYNDEARGHMQEVHVTLDDSDGRDLYKNWDSLSHNKKYEKLFALADIYTTQYAMYRGSRDEDAAKDHIRTTISKFLA